MHHPLGTAVLQEHGPYGLAVPIYIIIGMELLLRKLKQEIAPPVLLLCRHHMRNLQGHGARPFAVTEHMQLRDRQRAQEVEGLVEEFLRLSSGSHNHIHPDEGIWHQFLDALYLVTEECRVVPSVHESQHLVTSALQGDVEMRHEGTALCAEGNDLIRQQIGFYAADAIPLNALHTVQFAYQIQEGLSRCLSEVPDVDSRDDDFMSSPRSHLPGLFHQHGNASVAAPSPRYGYGAVGTVVITSILYLEEVARTVATGA